MRFPGLKRSDHFDAVREFINNKLPVENYQVLKYLIEFFNLVRRDFPPIFFISSYSSLQISVYSDTNLMTPGNLALIFGLILARSDDLNANTMIHTSSINIFIEYLIIHCMEIFLH